MNRQLAVSFFFIAFLVACATDHRPAPNEVTVTTVASVSGAEINGTVSLSRNPLPGATVTISGPFQGSRTTTTDISGSYRFTGLGAGDYKVFFEMESMQPVTRVVTVGPQTATQMDTTMHLAGVAELITVTASAPSVLQTTEIQASYRSRNDPPASRTQRSQPRNAVAPAQAPTVSGAPAFPADPTYGAEPQYATVADHAFTDVKSAPMTTFSIDVDRASYSNVRRYLAANRLPPANAVRVEEMINYFPYHDPQPSGSIPFSVNTEVAGCPWNLTHRLVRIGIQGKSIEKWKMAPNNLVFLLDVSGSMQPPARLPLIKAAFRLLVDQLRAEDSVAIVAYAGAAGLVLPKTSGSDKATILEAIDRMQSGGDTAGGAGIELAYKVAEENLVRDGNNRVILATDGDFNVGVSSMGDLTRLIEEKRSNGIFLTVLGVGDDNLQDAKMELLADKGNGMYAYLDSPKEAEKVFVRELTGSLVTIAKDVKVQLEFDPAHVASYRQIGYENRALANKDFSDDRKDAGELGAGHSVVALFEVVPAPGAPSSGTLATLDLRYKQPAAEVSELVRSSIVDEGKSVYQASTDLQFAAAVAEFGMLLRGSPDRGTATFAEAIALARTSHGDDLDGYRDEFVRMAETSRALTREAPPAIAGR